MKKNIKIIFKYCIKNFHSTKYQLTRKEQKFNTKIKLD